ncbi:hypothetical protein E3O44_12020 [Cryobacterium algoricola]|uniref:Alkaline shock response membrane anchor protein AmaP n=1 Tax=Cryobacterium algoricola TaxID=1259183 RepID=A0ABY2IAZ5_9MICO|nr:hypothetical protein [Cryobacterium algoricola]TFB86327.1 hypothetical protein E3O44_12020 [Cryobacterium algoricola]
MNSTNRVLNRLFILVVGLVVFSVGAALLLVAIAGPVRDTWAHSVAICVSGVTRWLRATPLPNQPMPISGSWLWLVALAAGGALIILLALFIIRQGHGHTRRLITVGGDAGMVLVDSRVAEHAIQDALSGRPELIASHVSTYQVKHQSVLKVAITCRRGISPREVSRIVTEVLVAFDTLLGGQLPALVKISAGIRARATQTARLH